MFDEEKAAQNRDRVFPANLENMSIEELRAYVTDLEAETARVQEDINRKQQSRDAAASVFKS